MQLPAVTPLGLLWVIALAVAADGVTTFYNVRIGARELNPALQTHGALLLSRLAVFTILVVIWMREPSMGSLQVAAAGWWALVAWNLVQIWRQRRFNKGA